MSVVCPRLLRLLRLLSSINLTASGFAVHFTRPVDPQSVRTAGALTFKYWHYLYRGEYGSPKVGLADDAVTVRSISDDARAVYVDLALEEGQVYQIITHDVRADDGASMSTTTGNYTLNHLLDQ